MVNRGRTFKRQRWLAVASDGALRGSESGLAESGLLALGCWLWAIGQGDGTVLEFGLEKATSVQMFGCPMAESRQPKANSPDSVCPAMDLIQRAVARPSPTSLFP